MNVPHEHPARRAPRQRRLPPNLAALDLNLLVVLDALLREGSATRAARRLARTQSAISHALGRLRDAFDDPLFVRVGHELKPTPRAETLRAPLVDVLARAGALLAPARFDPSQLERTFHLGSTDLFDAAMLPPLVRALAREAPGVSLVTRLGVEETERALQARELDLAIVTRLRSEAGLVFEPLFDDRLGVVLRKGNPALRKPIDLDAYCALGHVLVAPRGLPGGPVDDALAARGRSRRVVLQTTSFTAALRVVATSDLVTALPSQFRKTAGTAVTTRPLPISVPAFRFRLAWSAAVDHDPAHRFLRERVRAEILRAFGVAGRPAGPPLV